MQMLKNGLLVLAGGAIGAALRESLMLWGAMLPHGLLPIFIANTAATFLIGVFAGLSVKGGVIGPAGRLFFVTGITGGLSTFSSFVLGAAKTMAAPTEQAIAVMYLLLSMVIGFLLVELGLGLAARLMRARVAGAGASN